MVLKIWQFVLIFISYAFFSAPFGVKISASRSNRLSPGKTILNTELTGNSVASAVALGAVWRRESCCLYWKTNNGFSVVQPAACSFIKTGIF